MASTSLRWARPLLRQVTASSKAGPSTLSHIKFSTTAMRCDESDASWENALLDASSTPSPLAEPAANPPSGFRSSIMPGHRSTPLTRADRRSVGRTNTAFNLHIQASRNNTILCLTDAEGNPVTRVSTGMLGFKHSARSGYEAGHQTAIRMFNLIGENQTKWRLADLNLIYKGFGLGRDAVHRALLTDEGTQIRNLVRSVKDATRIKVGGTRPPKMRML